MICFLNDDYGVLVRGPADLDERQQVDRVERVPDGEPLRCAHPVLQHRRQQTRRRRRDDGIRDAARALQSLPIPGGEIP